MLPTFIGLGAQRAGMTWAYNCLAEHPEVFMTKKKELHFFYVNYDRGLPWYESQFEEAGGAVARGEITPDYLYHEKALANIAKDVPGVKGVVACLPTSAVTDCRCSLRARWTGQAGLR